MRATPATATTAAAAVGPTSWSKGPAAALWAAAHDTSGRPLDACWIDGALGAGGGERIEARDALGAARPVFAAATASEVGHAVATAARALGPWARRPSSERLEILRRFATLAAREREALARILAAEVGKPLWECREEAAALPAKVEQTAQAAAARLPEQHSEHPGFRGAVRYAPLGVFAVFVPFNLPLHLANGHLIPALLAGNTVVLKASELAPRASLAHVALLLEAGVPADAIQLVAGGRSTGEALVAQPQLAGVAFTGSTATGRAIHRALGGRPEVMIALEMGGNNPLVVLPGPDGGLGEPERLGRLIALSSFLTAGQRCTSARRLIVPRGAEGDRLIEALVGVAGHLRVDAALAEPSPFCGPLVTPEAADAVVAAAARRVAAGAVALLPPRRLDLSPAALQPMILDVSAAVSRQGPDAYRGAAMPDEEVFGPLLHVLRVDDREEAFAAAAATRFGLSAALLGGDEVDFQIFRAQVAAGIVNRNRPTNGALSTQPFGGVGWSGNHRPAGWTSVDYCAHAVASTEADAPQLPTTLPPGMN